MFFQLGSHVINLEFIVPIKHDNKNKKNKKKLFLVHFIFQKKKNILSVKFDKYNIYLTKFCF